MAFAVFLRVWLKHYSIAFNRSLSAQLSSRRANTKTKMIRDRGLVEKLSTFLSESEYQLRILQWLLANSKWNVLYIFYIFEKKVNWFFEKPNLPKVLTEKIITIFDEAGNKWKQYEKFRLFCRSQSRLTKNFY